ncbi:MAG: hypothetical protein ACP5OS_02690 [Leptospirillia bacterium]
MNGCKKTVKGLSALLLTATLLFTGMMLPAKSWAVTSAPGVWNLMVFGNYDMVSPNTGAVMQNSSTPTWNNELNNGYGAGLGLAYWFNDTIAFRLMVQGNFVQVSSSVASKMAYESAPITGGFEAKLYGDTDYYVYALVDAGAAYELGLPNTTSPTLSATGSTNAWSSYGDVGLGVNLDYVFVEVKIAYLMDSMPKTAGQNALWYIPVTAGFNF